MNKPYDATTKTLFEFDPAAWAAFLGIHRSPDRIRIVDADLSTITTAADKVLRIEDESPWLLHVEFQSSWDGSLPRRLLAYNAVLAEKHGLPVYTVVVLLAPRSEAAILTGRHEASPAFGPSWEFRYTVLRIWEQSASLLANGPIALVPLAPVASQPFAEVRETLSVVNRRIETEVDEATGGLLLTAIAYLLQLRFGKMTTKDLLREFPDFRENALYELLIEDGLEKGRVEGLRDTVLRQGKKRFGPITDEQRDSLNAIQKVDRLEVLTERVLDVSSWDELLRIDQ